MKLAVGLGTLIQDWEGLKSLAIECERLGVDSL